jgi:hypothetical protein
MAHDACVGIFTAGVYTDHQLLLIVTDRVFAATALLEKLHNRLGVFLMAACFTWGE